MKNFITVLFIALIAVLFITGCSGSSKTATNSNQVLDNNIFKQAAESGNMARCNDILDKPLWSECKQVVSDSNMTDEAIASMDKLKCSKVNDERYRNDCEKQVDAKMEMKNADTKRLTIEQKAINEGDASICDEIVDPNQNTSCKYNILANQAIQKKDPTICKLIGVQESIARCEQNF